MLVTTLKFNEQDFSDILRMETEKENKMFKSNVQKMTVA